MTTPCPDPETLSALAEGRLPSPAAREHLKACPACAAEVEAVRRDMTQIQPEVGGLEILRDLAAGETPLRRRSWIPLAAAACLALTAGVWWALREPAEAPGGKPPSVAVRRPSWIPPPSEGSRDLRERPVLLGGSVPAWADKSTRIESGPSRVVLHAGSLALDLPEDLRWTVAVPEGASASAQGTALWAERDAGAGQASLWIREAQAGGSTPGFRVWAERGTLTLRSPGPDGKTSEHAAPVLALWDGAAWEARPDPGIPASVQALKRAWPAPAGDWEVRGAAAREASGWTLGPSPGSLRLADPPLEGVLRLRVLPVEPGTELSIAFPQPGGSRLWRIGSWGGRRLGKAAVLSVAYGPWGAEGYADGELRWRMDPRQAEQGLPAAPEDLKAGILAAGGKVSVLEVTRLRAPEGGTP